MPAAARPTQAHSHAGGPALKPKLYNPRHPERTLLYQTIAEHFETWFELASSTARATTAHTKHSETLRDRPQLRAARQLCPQLIEIWLCPRVV